MSMSTRTFRIRLLPEKGPGVVSSFLRFGVRGDRQVPRAEAGTSFGATHIRTLARTEAYANTPVHLTERGL